MSLSLTKPKAAKKIYPRIGEGTYPARLVQVIDLGEHYKTNYYTGETEIWDDGNPKTQHKVWLTFELPTKTIDVDGVDKPRWISKEYTMSFHEKAALTPVVNALNVDGDAETLDDLLSNPSLVQVGSTKNDKDKINSVSAIVEGMTVGELYNDTSSFDIDNPDKEIFDKLPDFLKEKIVVGAKKGSDVKDWYEIKEDGGNKSSQKPETKPEPQGKDTEVGSEIKEDDIPF